MKHRRELIAFLLPGLSTACALVIIFQGSPAFAQDGASANVRSRAEHLAERRKVDVAFPELTRALRVLHLPSEKSAATQNILKRYEAETRAAREELRQVDEEQGKQVYRSGNNESPRAKELRTALQQSTDNLSTEIKALLTPQQREQLDRHLQKRDLHKDLHGDPRGQASGAQRGHP